MGYPVALIESLVRIHPSTAFEGRAFGSGVALGAGFVLTCAHVIDQTYAATAYDSKRGDIIEANNTLKAWCGETVAKVVFYDGSEHDATLVAVADRLDMVLLRTAVPGLLDPACLFSATSDFLDTTSTLAAYGFQHSGGTHFHIKAQALSAATKESKDFGAHSEHYTGTVAKGMSGGPIYRHSSDSSFTLAGISVMGDAHAVHMQPIRHQEIHAFLVATRERLKKDVSFHSWDKGLWPQDVAHPLGDAGQALKWIRVGDVTRICPQDDRYALFLAERPLTAHDIDTLYGRTYQPDLQRARQKTFARLRADEVQALCRTAQSLPGRAKIGIAEETLMTSLGLARNEAGNGTAEPVLAESLPPTVASLCTTDRGFAILPETTGEWALATGQDGDIRMVQGSAGTSLWRKHNPFGAPAISRALFRPLLKIPVWQECK